MKGEELQVQYICVLGLSLTRVLCTDRSRHHLLKCKPTTSATWYIFLLVKALPRPTFLSTSIMNSNWKKPCISISVLGEELRISVLFVQKGSLPLLESLFFLFRNLALKSFPVLCFASLVPCTGSTPSQIIPLVLGQSGRGKRWQHRAGLSVCFFSITLLILPAIWHIADETGYCFRSLY